MKGRKTIIELFIYTFILVVAAILLIQDKREPMPIEIHPDFTLQEVDYDATLPNE
ncbi:MAG: hypothetical protein M0T74_06880 [Desulfitobacterium hafniense]|nr:hypothetical protein [Desulfosporosinus sp.]MDA8227418.1 hypothetical protein [Desulfitobacterium hafniense]